MGNELRGKAVWERCVLEHEDTRHEKISVGETGVLEVEEREAGPGVMEAYGEGERVTRVTFLPEAAQRMLAACGGSDAEAVGDFLVASGDGVLALMDKADLLGIPYAYTACGEVTGMVYRPPMG